MINPQLAKLAYPDDAAALARVALPPLQEEPLATMSAPDQPLPKVVLGAKTHGPLAHTLSVADGMSGPVLPAQAQPDVRLDPDPQHQIEGHLTNKLQAAYRKEAQPKGFWGKTGDAIANTLDIHPTRDYTTAMEKQLSDVVGQESQNESRNAETANTKAEIPLHEAQAQAAQLVTINPEQAESLGNPSLAGQSVTQGVLQHLITTSQTVQGRKDVANISADARRDVADATNLSHEKVATLKPEQRDDRAIRLMQKPSGERTQEENAYLGAYARWVDQTKVQPGIARAQAFGMFRPVQVLGQDGEVHYDFSGNAIKSGASSPGSMNFRTAVGMAKFMTSGKGGQTVTAYNTATDHLEMLSKAADALNNGDVRMFNLIGNEIARQTGNPAPTNFEAIKTMVAGELANVAKVTGATDVEIKNMHKELDLAQSPEQLQGVVEVNQSLMDQKAKELYTQYTSGMSGQPAFKGTKAPATAAAKETREYQGHPYEKGADGQWHLQQKP